MTKPISEHPWTPKLVEERLENAAETLRRLPDERVRGYVSTWPAVIREFCDARDRHDGPTRLGPPQAAAIDRMDEALLWLLWLERHDARLVWTRACGIPWKLITARIGVGRTTAWRHWATALMVIAVRLNAARVPVRPDRAA